MKVWVARDKGGNENSCCAFRRKPSLKEDSYWDTGRIPSMVFEMSPVHFKKDFGFTPRKGSCKQMNLTLTEIE